MLLTIALWCEHKGSTSAACIDDKINFWFWMGNKSSKLSWECMDGNTHIYIRFIFLYFYSKCWRNWRHGTRNKFAFYCFDFTKSIQKLNPWHTNDVQPMICNIISVNLSYLLITFTHFFHCSIKIFKASALLAKRGVALIKIHKSCWESFFSEKLSFQLPWR